MRATVTAEELLGEAAWAQRLARHLLRDEATARDLMQDTWVAALRAPPGADGPLRPWLRQVIANLTRNRERDEGRRQIRHLAAAAEPVTAVPTPELLLGRMELRRTLAAAVTALAEPYRQTLLLRFYEGLSSAEIARATGVPAGTVRWRLKVALEDVRRRLDERHGGQRRDWLRAMVPLVQRRSPVRISALSVGLGFATLIAVVTWWLLPSGHRSVANPTRGSAGDWADSATGGPVLISRGGGDGWMLSVPGGDDGLAACRQRLERVRQARPASSWNTSGSRTPGPCSTRVLPTLGPRPRWPRPWRG